MEKVDVNAPAIEVNGARIDFYPGAIDSEGRTIGFNRRGIEFNFLREDLY